MLEIIPEKFTDLDEQSLYVLQNIAVTIQAMRDNGESSYTIALQIMIALIEFHQDVARLALDALNDELGEASRYLPF